MAEVIPEQLQEDPLASLLLPAQVHLVVSEVAFAVASEVLAGVDSEVASVVVIEAPLVEEEAGLAIRAAVALAEEVGMVALLPTAMVILHLPQMLLLDLAALEAALEVGMVVRPSTEA